MKKLLALGVVIAILFGVTAVAAADTESPVYDSSADAAVHKTVLFVGDSNLMFGAAALTTALVNRPNGYLPVFAVRGGIGIRGYKAGFCPVGFASPCAAPDYWTIHLAQVLAVVHPDAIVVDLGVNDTTTPGDETSAGYADYPQKMAWLLAQLPAGVPVFWSGLPTPIEPNNRAPGCRAIDTAISAQPGITVLHWYTAAYQHPDYMIDAGINVHYSVAGNNAYAAMVVAALDQAFPT